MLFMSETLVIQVPVVMGGAKQLNPEALKKYHEGIGFLEAIIGGRVYAAGDHLTVADLVLVASISSMDVSCYFFRDFIKSF